MTDPILLIAIAVWLHATLAVVSAHGRISRMLAGMLPGFLILASVGPPALVLALASVAWSAMVYLFCRRLPRGRLRTLTPYSILALVVLPDFVNAGDGTAILFLGSAFYLVRQFVTVKECLRAASGLREFAWSLSLTTFFFGTLFVGPIFNGLAAKRELDQNHPGETRRGLYRLFEGFVYAVPLTDLVSRLRLELDRLGQYAAVGDAPLFAIAHDLLLQPLTAFLFIFTTFYGYSRIAEGSAMLFGFHVPENFNRPHLATDFADFWKRWHRSMADFVMQYIYLPLCVALGRPRVAVLAAFLFMGIWHKVSPGYILWGCFHGLAVVWSAPLFNRAELSDNLKRLITLTSVILISYFANVWADQLIPLPG